MTKWKVSRTHSEKIWFKLPELSGDKSPNNPAPLLPNRRGRNTKSYLLGHYDYAYPGLGELWDMGGPQQQTVVQEANRYDGKVQRGRPYQPEGRGPVWRQEDGPNDPNSLSREDWLGDRAQALKCHFQNGSTVQPTYPQTKVKEGPRTPSRGLWGPLSEGTHPPSPPGLNTT